MSPRLLDLFCGAGGAAVGYHRAGFDEIVGVDLKPQPNYPFEFVQADALEFPLEGFDAIHASPPCQRYSALGSRYDKQRHPSFIALVREKLRAARVPYIIENVRGAPLHAPIQLCGSSFGLAVRRHRLFECSFPIMAPPCCHAFQRPQYPVYEHGKWFLSPVARVYGHGSGKATEHWASAMGIDWMCRDELSQAIPPAYTEFIGHQLLCTLEVAA